MDHDENAELKFHLIIKRGNMSEIKNSVPQKREFKTVFRSERCKSCSLCVVQCPKKILALSETVNAQGFAPAYCIDDKKCIGCQICARTCPDNVIEIYQKDAAPEGGKDHV